MAHLNFKLNWVFYSLSGTPTWGAGRAAHRSRLPKAPIEQEQQSEKALKVSVLGVLISQPGDTPDYVDECDLHLLVAPPRVPQLPVTLGSKDKACGPSYW